MAVDSERTGANSRARRRFIGVAVAAALVLVPPAVAAEVVVDETGFTPAVKVVPAGGTVEWRNAGTAVHGTRHDARRPAWDKPDLAPGETFAHRFTRPGTYAYVDPANPTATGTIVVRARAGRIPRPPRGAATHEYRATVTVEARERVEFVDPDGCESGLVERTVRWRGSLDVTYSRYPGIGESAVGSEGRGRFRLYRSTHEGTWLEDAEGNVCSDAGAPVEHSCALLGTGRRLAPSLAWDPKRNRVTILNYGPRIPPAVQTPDHPAHGIQYPDWCGISHVNVTELGPASSPLLFIGSQAPFDGFRLTATRAELARLRSGRPVRLVRELRLHAFVDCCVANTSGTVGGTFDVVAKVQVRLAPRG